MKNSIVNKNEKYVVDIIDYGIDGEGIAKIDGFTIFVQNAMRGEKCEILILKVLKTHAFAKIVNIIEKSKYRVEPDCKTYKTCGGCSLRHIDYRETLVIKREKVQNLVNKSLKNRVIVEDTIGMGNVSYYRNKAIYPVCIDDNGNKNFGIYSARTHKVVPFEECFIQSEISQQIARYIIDNYNGTIYDEVNNTGSLRNIMIRFAKNTNEVMVVLVQTDNNVYIDVNALVSKFPNIRTVVININSKNTNVVLSGENHVIYGDGIIEDLLGKYKFVISPNSFYQVNPVQTEVMYNLGIEMAALKKDDIICDLYCGIGTIGIFASEYVSKVYGIEIVDAAIENAKQNAILNNVKNIDFIVGDVEFAFDKLLKEDEVVPNIVFVDPPRKGLDDLTITNLNKLELDKIVYISCNPATLVRDLAKLENKYKVEKIVPVDNFCYTSHVETVALLSKLDVDKHIDVEIKLDELDLTSAESKATYAQIKEYVWNKFQLKVSTLYIAQIKRKCGIELREHYNKSKKEKQIIPQCTPEKEEAIMDALRHFKMIE